MKAPATGMDLHAFMAWTTGVLALPPTAGFAEVLAKLGDATARAWPKQQPHFGDFWERLAAAAQVPKGSSFDVIAQAIYRRNHAASQPTASAKTARLTDQERRHHERIARALADAKRSGREIIMGASVEVVAAPQSVTNGKVEHMSTQGIPVVTEIKPPDDPKAAVDASKKALGLPPTSTREEHEAMLAAAYNALEGEEATPPAEEEIAATARYYGLKEREVRMCIEDKVDIAKYAEQRRQMRRT